MYFTVITRYASKMRKQYISDKRKSIQRTIEKLRIKEKLKENENRIPIITTKRKEFNFYVGDKFNKFAPVLITQGWNHPKSKMDYFIIHAIQDKFIEYSPVSFKELGFSANFIENLSQNGIKVPTKIQAEAFSTLMEGSNNIIAAETGSGKTLAYLLPLVQQIFNQENTDKALNSPRGLILTPSRELAIQLKREATKLTTGTDIKTKVITGGRIKRSLRNPPVGKVDILISTLGALSKYVTHGVYKLNFLQHVVLDEADSLFDITFHEKLIPFLQKIKFSSGEKSEDNSPGAQLTLVSATMPIHVSSVLHKIINTKTIETVCTDKLHTINVPQKFIRIGPSQKPMLLLKLVKQRSKKTSFIIFTNTSETCNWISMFLRDFNVANITLNASMQMKVRRNKFLEFNNGAANILVTTDAGSRGLDTIQVEEVINYDFPLQTAEYIHRCGRTGRIGSPKDCKVTNFITRPLEIILARKIEIATKKGLKIPMVDMINRNVIEESGSLIDSIFNVEEAIKDELVNEEERNESENEETTEPRNEDGELYVPY